MTRPTIRAASAIAAATWLALPAGADEVEPALTDLVEILRENGVLDEGEYGQINARASQKEKQESWTDRITIWGDFRARYESFWFDEFDGGNDQEDRTRGRYRVRLNVKGRVNDRADVFLRLTSGGLDNRSTNQSFGGNADWGKDEIRIDLAYAEIAPFPEGRIPGHTGSWKFQMGRVPNPFRQKQMGKDYMLWDADINLEGVSTTASLEANDALRLFGNAGYFIDDENSDARDPQLIATQLGAVVNAIPDVEFGARTTWYGFRKLDGAFRMRGAKASPPAFGASTSSAGNLLGGLTDGDELDVVEAGAFVQIDCLEDWPIHLYGDWSVNTSAQSVLGSGKQDTAWGLGLEVGDKKTYAMIGAGYWHIEANAFPSMLIDSDVTDGITNREGWTVYGARQLFANTELNVTAFFSDPIERGGLFSDSLSGADRVRLDVDVVYKFQ